MPRNHATPRRVPNWYGWGQYYGREGRILTGILTRCCPRLRMTGYDVRENTAAFAEKKKKD